LAIDEAAEKGDIVHILLPDEIQTDIYENRVRKHMREGKTHGLSNGFNMRFKGSVPRE